MPDEYPANATGWGAPGASQSAEQAAEGQRRWDEADLAAKKHAAALDPNVAWAQAVLREIDPPPTKSVGGTTFPVCNFCGRAYDPGEPHQCPVLDELRRPPAAPPGATGREAVMVSIGEAKHGGYYVASAATETRRAEILFTGDLDKTLAFIRGHMEEAGAPMAMAE